MAHSPKEDPADFVSLSVGHRHVCYCHYGCLGFVLAALEEGGLPSDVITVWSLRSISPSGLKIDYCDLSCFIAHNSGDPEEEVMS